MPSTSKCFYTYYWGSYLVLSFEMTTKLSCGFETTVYKSCTTHCLLSECFQFCGRCYILQKMSNTRLYFSYLKSLGFIYVSNISTEGTHKERIDVVSVLRDFVNYQKIHRQISDKAERGAHQMNLYLNLLGVRRREIPPLSCIVKASPFGEGSVCTGP